MLRIALQNFDFYLKETKPDTKNASNWNYFGFGVNNKSKCDETAIFRVSLQNLDLQLNETKLDTENVSNLNYFGFGVTVNENVMKWLFFMFFCRILTCVLSIRRRKT